TEFQARRVWVMCAEHAHNIEPIVHFVSPAEAAIVCGLGKKPTAAAVVQSDAALGAAAQAQRCVLGNTEGGREVVQQNQGVPASASKLPREIDRGRQARECVGRAVEREFVERNDLVVGAKSA